MQRHREKKQFGKFLNVLEIYILIYIHGRKNNFA
jgi:hypothetical protein